MRILANHRSRVNCFHLLLFSHFISFFCRAGLQQQRPIIPGAGTTLGGMQRLLLERKGRGLSVLEDENAATHLLRHALGDDGYGTVAPNRLAKMLSLPAELARRYRDDITITVVHLNEPDL